MHTILGAGGAIGNELTKVLAHKGKKVRLVGRHPHAAEGASETLTADVSDLSDTIRAVAGSEVVYLTVGLKYDRRVWAELWPRIMSNAIEACKRAATKLVFFDNVYMYGKVRGPMTEENPFNPCSVKGEIRARIASVLLKEMATGSLTALIARSADFYGPGARTGVPNVLVFDRLAKKAKASWLADDAVRHSFTFTPDAAASLALLAEGSDCWNQTWHVPTAADPPTGRQFIEMAARSLGVEPRYRVLGRTMLKFAGWFDTTIRELGEMLYQNEAEYLFDSSKFEKAFGFQPTAYSEGIRITARNYGVA